MLKKKEKKRKEKELTSHSHKFSMVKEKLSSLIDISFDTPRGK